MYPGFRRSGEEHHGICYAHEDEQQSDSFPVVRNGIILRTQPGAQDEHGQIAGQMSESRGPIGVLRHENDIDEEGDCQSSQGDPDRHVGTFRELVPHGDIEAHPQKHIAQQHDGDDPDGDAEISSEEEGDDVDIPDNPQEDDGAEGGEILHDEGIQTADALFLGLLEKEGLCGIAEHLDEKIHDHRQFHGRLIDAQRCPPSLGGSVEEAEKKAVGKIIGDSREGGDHQGNGIGQHPLHKVPVPGEMELKQIRNEKDEAQDAADEDGEDRVSEIRLCRIDEKQEQVGADFRKYFDALEDGELESLVLLPEFRKKDGRYAVAKENGCDIDDETPVAFIAQRGGNNIRESDHHGQEGHVEPRHGQKGSRVNLSRILSLFVRETEATGLESQHQNHLQDGDIGKEFRDHTVLNLREHPGIYGYEKEVQHPCQDGREAVDGGFFRQLLQRCMHVDTKIVIIWLAYNNDKVLEVGTNTLPAMVGSAENQRFKANPHVKKDYFCKFNWYVADGTAKSGGITCISGGTVLVTCQQNDGAGIGGGRDANCGMVKITGGHIQIIAWGKAAIGTGDESTTADITITGGTVDMKRDVDYSPSWPIIGNDPLYPSKVTFALSSGQCLWCRYHR